MYSEFLRKRINSLNNGLSTDGAVLAEIEHERTEVVYDVFDFRGQQTISFGRLSEVAITKVSRAAAVANLVSYGWELLDLGARCVVVSLLGKRFICDQKRSVDLKEITETIEFISDKVFSCQVQGSQPIQLWSSRAQIPYARYYYEPPERRASRNSYLGNLGQYLTKIYNFPIQLGLKSCVAQAGVEFNNDPKIVPIVTKEMFTELARWSSDCARIFDWLDKQDVVFYDSTVLHPEAYKVYCQLTLRLSNINYSITLYTKTKPADRIEKGLLRDLLVDFTNSNLSRSEIIFH